MATRHKADQPTLRSLTKRQWIRIASVCAAVGLVVAGGAATRSIYSHASGTPTAQPTAYSISDEHAASRGNARDALDGEPTYVNVTINGKTRTVLGTDFTDVKSVLDAGDITLESGDTVEPSLKTKVDESTTITINRAGAKMETEESKIPFNTIKKETSSLPKGTEQVETEGQEGILEKTNLVERSGDKVISSNTFASWVKKAPVEKVILVGTADPQPAEQPQPTTDTSDSASSSGASSDSGSASQPASGNSIGTTAPVGEMQQWAHDYLLANGGTEADFTATVFIISHESGWSVTATNPSSGAYGLAQALPGSKMASHGADWATNYQTQLKWFWDYCKDRYGSIQGAYSFWQANHWY